MRYASPLVPGVLVRRYKRFLADVLVDGALHVVHCPNPGRMDTCLADGAPVRLSHHSDPRRKLAYTLEQIEVDGTWIAVHPALSNRVVAEALDAGVIAELAGYRGRRSEVRVGDSRVDFVLDGHPARPDAVVEVKTVSLKDGRLGRFPDAVSARATRHLRELAGVVGGGRRAVALLWVARGDVDAVAPADAVDPAWGDALRAAVDVGVEVIAWQCRVLPDRLEPARRLPVLLRA